MDLSPRRLALRAIDSASRWLSGGEAGATAGRGRLDEGPPSTAMATRPSGGVAHLDAAQAHLDAACGDGGCSSLGGYGARNWFGSPRELLEFQAGLSWELIDWLCVDELMNKTATLLPEDACAVRPEMTGPTLGELDDVWLSLKRRGYDDVEERRLIYSFKYGGGATVCFVNDGRRADQPVDLSNVREVIGFYSLPRHWVIPDQPSADVRAGWWGPRGGRPEHYNVNPATAGAEADRFDPSGDIRAILRDSGQRFHASRIIASPYRPELDWRSARRFPNWRGWGPGIVEGVVPVFEARRWGMLRIFDFMNGLGYDVLTGKGAPVTSAKSTPSGGWSLKEFLRGLKGCRDMTGDGVGVIALDEGMALTPLTRQAAGLHDITEEQRKMFLDCVPYPRVVIFGETQGGLNGGGAEGEWQQYGRTTQKYNRKRRWPGLRHASILTMADKSGPTNGEVDLDIEADFPNAYQASDAERSASRKADAESRALDKATLNLTPKAMLALDPSIERTYPGVTAMLEAAEVARRSSVSVAVPAGLPAPSLAAPVAPLTSAPAAAAATGGPAITPATAVQANAAAPVSAATPSAQPADKPIVDEAPAPAPAPAESPAGSVESPLAEPAAASGTAANALADLPTDTATEVELARALKMTRSAFRKWAASVGVAPVAVLGKGARGGDRYSVGAVKAAAKARTDARLDALLLDCVPPS